MCLPKMFSPHQRQSKFMSYAQFMVVQFDTLTDNQHDARYIFLIFVRNYLINYNSLGSSIQLFLFLKNKNK